MWCTRPEPTPTKLFNWQLQQSCSKRNSEKQNSWFEVLSLISSSCRYVWRRLVPFMVHGAKCLILVIVFCRFQCLRCQYGCDTCVDSTPCMFEYRQIVRVIVVFTVILLITGCGFLSIVTFKCRLNRVSGRLPYRCKCSVSGGWRMCVSVGYLFTH